MDAVAAVAAVASPLTYWRTHVLAFESSSAVHRYCGVCACSSTL